MSGALLTTNVLHIKRLGSMLQGMPKWRSAMLTMAHMPKARDNEVENLSGYAGVR
jgi:hypothetical protein